MVVPVPPEHSYHPAQAAAFLHKRYEHTLALPLQEHHILCASLLYVRCSYYKYDGDLDKLVSTAKQYAALFDSVLQYPNRVSAAALFHVSQHLAVTPGVGLDLARVLSQRSLRMKLLRRGREDPGKLDFEEVVDHKARLVDILHRLSLISSQTPSVMECMLCGERPWCAAITLNKCGKCGRVAYCSKACQTAHWKVHKKVCKK